MWAAVQGRRRVVVLVVVAVALVAGVVLAIVLGTRGGSSGAAGPSSSSSAPSSSSEPPASSSSSGAGSSSAASSSSAPASPSADPSSALAGVFGDQPLTVVQPSAPATPAAGVQVQITSATAVTTAGEGVGQVNGKGVLVSFAVVNGTDKAIALDGVTVTAYQQGTPVPASPVDRDPQATPFSGSVAPGATARGSYLFADPGTPLTVAVQLDTASAVAVFDGVAAS